jgi:hypothetical protein
MPHLDTDADEVYDFVASEGADDGPYVADGSAVTDAANVTVAVEGPPAPPEPPEPPEPPAPMASVTFGDQTTNGSSVTVAASDNDTAPYYTAVWTLTADGEPDQLLGAAHVDDTSATNLSVALDPALEENATLVAAVHPDADGDASTSDDPVADRILAADTANLTVAADEPPAPTEASVTFDDQTTNGSAVTVAEAGNGTAPYYVAVWTLTADGDPETLHGFTQVTEPSVSDLGVSLDVEIDSNGTVAAVVHPDADGDTATTTDPVVASALAIDVANVTVGNATAAPTA